MSRSFVLSRVLIFKYFCSHLENLPWKGVLPKVASDGCQGGSCSFGLPETSTSVSPLQPLATDMDPVKELCDLVGKSSSVIDSLETLRKEPDESLREFSYLLIHIRVQAERIATTQLFHGTSQTIKLATELLRNANIQLAMQALRTCCYFLKIVQRFEVEHSQMNKHDLFGLVHETRHKLSSSLPGTTKLRSLLWDLGSELLQLAEQPDLYRHLRDLFTAGGRLESSEDIRMFLKILQTSVVSMMNGLRETGHCEAAEYASSHLTEERSLFQWIRMTGDESIHEISGEHISEEQIVGDQYDDQYNGDENDTRRTRQFPSMSTPTHESEPTPTHESEPTAIFETAEDGTIRNEGMLRLYQRHVWSCKEDLELARCRIAIPALNWNETAVRLRKKFPTYSSSYSYKKVKGRWRRLMQFSEKDLKPAFRRLVQQSDMTKLRWRKAEDLALVRLENVRPALTIDCIVDRLQEEFCNHSIQFNEYSVTNRLDELRAGR
ncbi:hypothetical protein PMIN02_002697 [Paraphaeosphaeria minitans]